jgi:CHAT domain-containing protein
MSLLRREENPLLRSGIVLAGANQMDDESLSNTVDDGWVTAEEIALHVDLRGTELVVLSACETGLGDVRNGEGVSGLRRAFLHAGAQTLVTSLYKVPDRETQELMQEMYTRLATGATKLAAFHGAQLEMIRRRREAHDAAHPLYWGGFVLVGEPE